LLFHKGKKTTDIMFVDASREFEAGKKQNRLRSGDIAKIVEAVSAGTSIDKYARRATMELVRENEFNLNISRYVDTFEEDGSIDIGDVRAEIDRLEAELAITGTEIRQRLAALGLS